MTLPLRTTLALVVAVAAVVGAIVGTIDDDWAWRVSDNHGALTLPDRHGARPVRVRDQGVDWPSGQGRASAARLDGLS